jgi:CDP-glycerol glycerophosphotransferase (TagB/SpsB family)
VKVSRKNLKREFQYWSQIILLPIYLLSHLSIRSKEIWLFGSTFGSRFADNPKYFYLYMQQYHKEIKSIWITKNKSIAKRLKEKGYEAYYSKSLRGIYYCLRGKMYFFDNYSKDICFWLSGRAIKYNFWHGIPLKKIQMDNIFDKVRHPENKAKQLYWSLRRLSDEKPSHYVLTTSNFLKPIFKSAFQTDKVEVYPYPRNEYLITNEIQNIYLCDEDKVLSRINKEHSNKRLVMYMPTFRESEKKFFDVVELGRFYSYLEDSNILLIVKLHPKSKLKEQFQKITSDTVVVLPAEYDPYPFLKSCDMLITDYSSIYFDFLLLDKPIIFFNYDLEDYLSESRELYFDYDKFTPGIKAKTMDELEIAIDNAINQDEQWKKERSKIRDLVIENQSDDGLESLFRRIQDLIKQ